MDERIKRLAPSILAGNHANLKDALLITDKDGREWIHLDIMDGHYVPNITFGPNIVRSCRKITSKILDVHLMIKPVEPYIREFIDAGSDIISFHPEADEEVINLGFESGEMDGLNASDFESEKERWNFGHMLEEIGYNVE
mgnify:CR=1 FL=1